MSANLPPLNPLYTFVTAAQSDSFTAAAAELRVSQAAVSRQVGVLENALGVKLFERHGRRVRLTNVGRTYLRDVGPAFDSIAQATRQLASGNDPRTVRVQVYPTFTARWLLARLPTFSAKHPDCNVRLETGIEPVDFSRKDLEIAVQFGDGNWQGLEAIQVFNDLIEPVCSPKLIERLGKLDDARDLANAPILRSHYRRRDWNDWLIANNWTRQASERDQMFDSSLLTYRAAMEGLGIAMGQTHLLHDIFAAGTLVRPFSAPLARELGYYAVWPSERRVGHGMRRFLSWLLEEGEALRSLY